MERVDRRGVCLYCVCLGRVRLCDGGMSEDGVSAVGVDVTGMAVLLVLAIILTEQPREVWALTL